MSDMFSRSILYDFFFSNNSWNVNHT